MWRPIPASPYMWPFLRFRTHEKGRVFRFAPLYVLLFDSGFLQSLPGHPSEPQSLASIGSLCAFCNLIERTYKTQDALTGVDDLAGSSALDLLCLDAALELRLADLYRAPTVRGSLACEGAPAVPALRNTAKQVGTRDAPGTGMNLGRCSGAHGVASAFESRLGHHSGKRPRRSRAPPCCRRSGPRCTRRWSVHRGSRSWTTPCSRRRAPLRCRGRSCQNRPC